VEGRIQRQKEGQKDGWKGTRTGGESERRTYNSDMEEENRSRIVTWKRRTGGELEEEW
jgi:hypothetical protein